MKTARQFERMGAEFLHEQGSLTCVAPDELVPELVSEVTRRMDLMVPQIPAVGSIPIITIASFEEKRWGACMTCGDVLPEHVGGMCSLCILALKKALNLTGRITDRPDEKIADSKKVATLVMPAVPEAFTAPAKTTEEKSLRKPPANLHTCHAIGCKDLVQPRYLMCYSHWSMVSSTLQSRVWATYVEGQEIRKDPTPEYLEAQEAAVRYVAQKEGKLPKEIAVTEAMPMVVSPAVKALLDEYRVYIEAFCDKNVSAYCVTIVRGKNSIDFYQALPGKSILEDAYCEGFVKSLEMLADKQAPIAICVTGITWSVTSMPPWNHESEYATKAREAWKQHVATRTPRCPTRVFKPDASSYDILKNARRIAYLEVLPGGIFAPENIPA